MILPLLCSTTSRTPHTGADCEELQPMGSSYNGKFMEDGLLREGLPTLVQGKGVRHLPLRRNSRDNV